MVRTGAQEWLIPALRDSDCADGVSNAGPQRRLAQLGPMPGAVGGPRCHAGKES